MVKSSQVDREKTVKVKLSLKQTELIRGNMSWWMGDEHGLLQGYLLTTMDAAIENDRQVEGMKSRIKDIQNRLWDEIYRQEQSILGSIFFSDASKAPIADSDSEIKKAMEKFIEHVCSMINDEFQWFLVRLTNLMGMVFSDSKQKCVVEEIDRIVNHIRYRLSRGIARNLRRKFGIKVEDDN